MIKADCTWGEGEDVLVTLEDHNFMLYENPKNMDRATHGYVDKGSFFLTAEEAKQLATDLLKAVEAVNVLEESLEHYNEVENVNLRPVS